jgi:tetratricopeptide (TPR) repeat protein
VVSFAKPKKTVLLASSPLVAIIPSSLFLLALVFGVSLLFVQGQKYIAEVEYARGSTAFASGDATSAILQILSAANANPSVDIYWRDLAQLYLTQLNQISADKTLSDVDKTQQVKTLVTNAATVANQAVRVSPLNVENWNVRGFVYRNLIGVPNADTLAIESYTKAGLLEPASPFSFTELGRVYLIKAQDATSQTDVQRQQELMSALENLNKALALKPDYSPALYLTALVYGAQGKTDDEIAKLESAKTMAPNDIGLAFQLGVIYYQKKDFTKAQAEFERIKGLNPDYANGRYMLGLVYDRQGEQGKAIEEFTRVLELNPDNTQVKQILSNLKNNKPALTGLSSASSLVSDNPPEIKTETKPAK